MSHVFINMDQLLDRNFQNTKIVGFFSGNICVLFSLGVAWVSAVLDYRRIKRQRSSNKKNCPGFAYSTVPNFVVYPPVLHMLVCL